MTNLKTVLKLTHRDDWLAKTREEIIDPDIEIVDPHHHLWNLPGAHYELDELWADTGSGHNVVQTVYVECLQYYDTCLPPHMAPVGETRQIAEWAVLSQDTPNQAEIAGIVSYADLAHPELAAILDAHEAAGDGRFRGIRHAGAYCPNPEGIAIPGRAAPDLYETDAFRRGVAHLGERGLVYDTWHYYFSNPAYLELARAVPGTTFVLDHLGFPLNAGIYRGRREEIFARWKDDIAAIAECPNVFAKIGGLGTLDSGFDFCEQQVPPGSDQIVDEQGRYYWHIIDCFGPERCMFESNFPVDRLSMSYHVLWNAFKKLAMKYAPHERNSLLHGTARKVYNLPAPNQ